MRRKIDSYWLGEDQKWHEEDETTRQQLGGDGRRLYRYSRMYLVGSSACPFTLTM